MLLFNSKIALIFNACTKRGIKRVFQYTCSDFMSCMVCGIDAPLREEKGIGVALCDEHTHQD